MNQKLLFICLFFAFSSAAYAQQWAPLGAKWTYGVAYAFSPNAGYKEWVCSRDTLINGQSCRVIEAVGSPLGSDFAPSIISYEDSGIVYWYHQNQFTVLYDFNKNAGESWITMSDSCAIEVYVDSTYIDTINGAARKVLLVSSPLNAIYGTVVEGIGFLQQPTPDIIYSCWGWVFCADYYTGLRCYEENELGLCRFQGNISCDYTYTYIRPIAVDEVGANVAFRLFPNPANEQLHLQTEQAIEANWQIYNALGEPLKKGTTQGNTTTIDIQLLPAGAYFLELRSSNSVQALPFRKG